MHEPGVVCGEDVVSKIIGIMPPHITPFRKDEEIDESALRSLIHFWIDSGCSGLVPCGSNGEAPYMTRGERRRVIEIVVNEVNSRIPVIAGTGAPSTNETVKLTQDAKEAGADAALIVSPYYYKPSDKEVLEHYRVILDAADIPVILYNVPKFTGYNLNVSIVVRLVDEYDQVIGIKDSSGSIGQIYELISLVGRSISILAGTGDVMLPTLIMGGAGAIVALANVAPRLCSNIYASFKKGSLEDAKQLQVKALHLNKVLVKRFNQISSIKEALNQLGQPAGYPRRPALPLDQRACEEIKRALCVYA